MSTKPEVLRSATHAYVGLCRCGAGVSAVAVDLGDRDTAKFVADLIKDGRAVERRTLEEARQSKWCSCAAPRRPQPDAQETLL